jgi:hypothetical protein
MRYPERERAHALVQVFWMWLGSRIERGQL